MVLEHKFITYLSINSRIIERLNQENFVNANKYYSKTISLPLHTLLTEKDVEFIASKVISVLKKHK